MSFRKNLTWTLLGNVVYAASQWGILVILAKLSSPESVGQFALGLAITAPAFMLTRLQLRAVLATDVQGQYQFNEYFLVRVITVVFTMGMLLAILCLFGYSYELMLIIFGIGLAKSLESISDIFYGLFQKQERMDILAKSMMIKGFISLIAFGAVQYLWRELLYSVWALVFSWGIILFCYDLLMGFRVLNESSNHNGSIIISASGYKEIDYRKLTGLIKISMPMGIAMMIGSLNTNVPRYFLEYYSGAGAVGYFSAISYLMVVGAMIIGAIGQTASPRLAKYYTQDLNLYKKLLAKLIALSCLVGLLGIIIVGLLGEEILTILYRYDYAQYKNVLVWMTVATVISWISGMLGVGLTAARQFTMQMYISLFSLFSLFVLSAIIIPDNGIIGTAWAFFASSLVTAIIWIAMFCLLMKKR